ncbi:MAG: hypothetical protein HY216_13360 [Candidatus Rokubacteria bacterium]|nr:hypothetical protein [Candidatus Rokubacteria bacterium]
MRGRAGGLAMVAVFVTALALFGILGSVRAMDDDEGFYALFARLVAEGRTPYLDFFSSQNFLLPYVYAPAVWLAGPSWYALRWLSAVFTALLAALIYGHVRARTDRASLAVLAAALFMTCTFTITWYTTVKTYAWTALCIFAAYALVTGGGLAGAFGAGVLLALAVDARVYLVVLVPLYAWWAWRAGPAPSRGRVGAFAGGVALGLLPGAVFLWRGADAYSFAILRSHGVLRGAHGLVGDFGQKAFVALQALGMAPTWGTSGIQFPLLLVLLGAGVLAARARGGATARDAWPAPREAWVVGVLLAVSLLPTPAFLQYFAVTIPFLTVGAALVVDGAWPRHTGGAARDAWVIAALLGLYFAHAPLLLYRAFRTAADAPAGAVVTLPAARAVGHAVSELARGDGRPAVVFWSGYLFESRVSPLPGLEYHPGITLVLDPARRARYHLIAPDDIERAIRERRVSVTVIGADTAEYLRVRFRPVLTESGYVVRGRIGDVDLYGP